MCFIRNTHISLNICFYKKKIWACEPNKVLFRGNIWLSEWVTTLQVMDTVSYKVEKSRMWSHLLGARAADVRPKHDLVWSLPMHVLLVKLAVKHFDVTASAVNLLLMFDRELDDQGFTLIAEGLEFAWECIETSVFRSF